MLVVSVYFLPILRSATGKKTARCDFCERPVELPVGMNRIEAASWKPSDGMEMLATKLEMNCHALPAQRDYQARLRSLLSAVAEASTFDRLDVSLGLTTGLLLGGIAGGLIGHYVVPRRAMGMDDLARVFAGVAAGLALGAIVGASLLALLRRRSAPFRRLRNVCRGYRINPSSLIELAGDSPRRVRSALKRINAFWLLEPME